jgi:hypothetical protein
VYRVQEIGPAMQPWLSGWRWGSVAEYSLEDGTIQILPWPHADVHPMLEDWKTYKAAVLAGSQVHGSTSQPVWAVLLPVMHALHGHSGSRGVWCALCRRRRQDIGQRGGTSSRASMTTRATSSSPPVRRTAHKRASSLGAPPSMSSWRARTAG